MSCEAIEAIGFWNNSMGKIEEGFLSDVSRYTSSLWLY